MNLNNIILTVQHFTRRWPEMKRFPAEAARAAQDKDGGFERLLRASLEIAGIPGDVALARELNFADGRNGAVVPRHELDFVLRLSDGPFIIESKAWQDLVDKDAVMIFLGKVLDFIAAPRFDGIADSVRVGFVGLSGFTEAARRLMFSFGVVPFSKVGTDISFRFLDLQLAELERALTTASGTCPNVVTAARQSIAPFVIFEARHLTSIVRVDGDEAVVDLGGLRRGAALYDEARSAHALALDVYRKVVASRSR